MMAARYAHAKTFRLQQLANFVKAYVSIGLAAEKLFERFSYAHCLIQFHPTLKLIVDGILGIVPELERRLGRLEPGHIIRLNF